MPHLHRSIAGCCLTLLLGAAAATVGPPAEAGDLSGVASRAVATARRPAPPAVKFDPAVVPAGGAGCCSVNNGHGQVRQAGFHHGHAPGCRDGMCVPSCPVRPGQFGYYGTQWRRWPGQGVVQTSAAEAATPVKPPRSAVPGAEEESPTPRDGAVAAEPQDALDEEPQTQSGRPRVGDESLARTPGYEALKKAHMDFLAALSQGQPDRISETADVAIAASAQVFPELERYYAKAGGSHRN
jgi:hypothetical protein